MIAEVFFLPAARREVEEAVDWYERASPLLALRFQKEVDAQVDQIAGNARRFPIITADVRRALLRGFPYGLFFREVDGALYVIACFHSSRDPIVWQKRNRRERFV